MSFDTAITSLYSAHVAERRRRTEEALAASGFSALLISSGTPIRYYADDQEAPFRSFPHFAHWVPLEGPHHILCIRPGEIPTLIRVKPDDYWYEQEPLENPFWISEFDFQEVKSINAAWNVGHTMSHIGKAAYIGDNPEMARKQGIAPECINPPELIARLDKNRSFKTEYEIACIAEANTIAAKGHRAAREEFLNGRDELFIHQAYLAAVGCTEKELPYETIVALNEKAATLHYQGKRTGVSGKSFLLDAGAHFLGYASDITRTWAAPSADPLFTELIEGVEKLQQELCVLAKPGFSFAELHHAAHIKIADLLLVFEILNVGGEEAVSRAFTKAFFPHGVGHMLGIQVHDVGGIQKVIEFVPADGEHLRTNALIEEGQVFTVEPGVYFIPMLLRPHRMGDNAEYFNWPLIDQLIPYGGVRIEDNVLVAKGGLRNLTREQEGLS